MLRDRTAKKEEPLGVHVPDRIVSREGTANPAHQAQLAESMGLALLVVFGSPIPLIAAGAVIAVHHTVFYLFLQLLQPFIHCRRQQHVSLLGSRIDEVQRFFGVRIQSLL